MGIRKDKAPSKFMYFFKEIGSFVFFDAYGDVVFKHIIQSANEAVDLLAQKGVDRVKHFVGI